MKQLIAILMVLSSFLCIGGTQRKAYYRHQAYDSTLDNNMRISFMDSLLLQHPDDSIDLRCDLTEILFLSNQYPRVITESDSLLANEANLSEDNQLKIRTLLARALSYTGNYNRCLTECRHLLDDRNIDSHPYYKSIAYSLLYYIIHRVNNKDGEYFINKIKEIENTCPDTYRNRIKFTRMLMELNDLKIKRKFTEAFILADSIAATTNVDMQDGVMARVSVANLYLVAGEDDIAINYYQDIITSKPWDYNKWVALLNLTHLLNKHGKYDQTLSIVNPILDSLNIIKKDINHSYLLYNVADALYNTGDPSSAYEMLCKGYDELENLLHDNNNNSIEATLRNDNLKTQIVTLSDKLNTYKVLSIVLTILSLSLLAGGIIFIINWRRATKKIIDLTHKLTETEDSCRQEVCDFKKQISAEQRSLTSSVLHMAQLTETIDLIRDLCKDNTTTDAECMNTIRNAMKTLAPQKDLWNLFTISFDQVHSDFYKRLYAKHHDLTSGEARMCAYIIMNLSIKEIATLINRSVRSVEASRYRLSKKLNLEGTTQLTSYLRSFLENA